MFDFKGMKKVSETPHKATFAHPSGHKIHIAKAALSPEMQKQISALPIHNFDEGGKVGQDALPTGQDAIPTGQDAPPDAPNQVLPAAPSPGPGLAGGPLAVAEDAYATPRQEMLEGSAATQSPAPEAAPQPPEDPNALIKATPGGKEALNAVNMAAEAQKGEAASAAQAQKEYQQGLDSLHTSAQIDYSNMSRDIDGLTHDIMNGHINPNQYMENKSTGSKIATAIGLLFGGIGSAKTGGQNPALMFLQSQIQRDIESQKANMDNKHSLLSALERQYGNRQVAEHMASATLANVTASKIAQAQASAASPLAEAGRQQAIAALKQQAAVALRQANLANIRGKLEGGTGPGAEGMADAYQQALRQASSMGSPEAAKELEDFQKHRIPGVGVAKVPLEEKDREYIQKNTELRDLLQRANSNLSHSGKLGPLAPSNRAEAISLQNQIQLRMGEIANLNRFTGEENHIYRQTVPDLVGTHLTGQDSSKLQQLIKSVNANENTFYQQKGINRQAGDTDRVTVIAPNGKSGSIPSQQLHQALSKGFKRAQ